MLPAADRTQQSQYNWPVLSIKQPWAQLILEGIKDVEVRSWTTSYRGPIWIHVGQKIDESAAMRFSRTGLFTGGLVGRAILHGIRPFTQSSWEAWRERHCDDARFNQSKARYGWILRDATPLVPPIEVKGKRRLFHLGQEALNQLDQHPDSSSFFRTMPHGSAILEAVFEIW